MRTHGKLTKWNDDRGFGFIEPSAAGTDEIFVHVSAFPRDGVRPQIGEFISFEIEQRADGRKHALHVMRPGARAASPRRKDRAPRAAARQGPLAGIISVLLLAGIGCYAYTRFTTAHAPSSSAATRSSIHAVLRPPEPSFTCDGRAYCSQMRSCAEATYFIRQCPGTHMDGDGDGVPCERQLCNGSQAD